MAAGRVLVIDDDPWIREYLAEFLSDEGYETDCVGPEHDPFGILNARSYDVVVTDVVLGDMDGYDVLQVALSQSYHPELLLITARGSTDGAVSALKLGAFDYITKPFDSDRLRLSVRQAIERRRLKAQVRHLSNGHVLDQPEVRLDTQILFFDEATGLPNRALFFDRLEQAIVRREQSSQTLAVIAIDIVGFDRFNTHYGTEAGDQLIAEAARRITSVFYSRDTTARVGTEKIGVVAEVKQENDIFLLLDKLLAASKQKVSVLGHAHSLKLALGVSLFPNDGPTARALLDRALAALATQRESSEETGYTLYDRSLHQELVDRFDMERRLSQAADDNDFELHYQPIFDAESSRPVGLEGLLRWKNAKGQIVPPSEFVPMLEQSGQIVRVTEWLIRKAAQVYRNLQSTGMDLTYVSVNLSGHHLRSEEASERILELISKEWENPSSLMVELTESSFLNETEQVRKRIEAIKRLGVLISVDDFGTGYSSLSYLRRFPLDYLKIDRSFVAEVHTNPDDKSIVAAIIAMANQLGLETIAEGVEIKAHVELLSLLGCSYYQGFFCAEPMPQEEVMEFLRQFKSGS